MYEEKYVKTTDNWHNNFDGDKVRVKIMNRSGAGFVRVCAWGNDDYGLELDFKGTKEECDAKYIEWKENIYGIVPIPCTKNWFKELGFTEA